MTLDELNKAREIARDIFKNCRAMRAAGKGKAPLTFGAAIGKVPVVLIDGAGNARVIMPADVKRIAPGSDPFKAPQCAPADLLNSGKWSAVRARQSNMSTTDKGKAKS